MAPPRTQPQSSTRRLVYTGLAVLLLRNTSLASTSAPHRRNTSLAPTFSPLETYEIWLEAVRRQSMSSSRPDGGLRKSTILKNMKVRKIVKLEEEEACVICQGDLYRRGKKKNVVPILHNCGHHQFHAKCMKKWLMCKNTCPLCNAVALNVR